MKTVSIIVPVYNVEKYLSKCLESLTKQTYKELEIICVDDGTPDLSVEIIKDFQAKDDRIKLISQENQGLSGARNTGIKSATGEYIMFVDSDDWIDTDCCETAVKNADENNATAVLWGYVREFGEKSSEKRIFDGDRVFNADETKHIIHRRMAGLVGDELSNPENADSLVTAWGKLYLTDIIKSNGLEFVDTKIIGTEDALFNLQYFGFVNKCVFVDRPFNHYRKDNETSLTRKYKPLLFSQWSELYRRMDEYIKSNNLPDEFSLALSNRICLSMIGLGLNELCNDGKGATKNIKKILSSQMYADAYKHLDLSRFPMHWRIFFLLCKNRSATGVYAMLKGIQMMIGK